MEGKLPRVCIGACIGMGTRTPDRIDRKLAVMRASTNTKKNPTVSVIPAILPRMPWRVVSAEALSHFRLKVRFVDGTEGMIDLSKLVASPDAGVFAALADPALFDQVFVEYGAVTWPGEIDLAPDAMYDRIKQSSLPVIY